VRNAELQQQGSGIDELQDAVEQTFNIQINHVIRFNFEGFVEIVDVVGGVEIDVPKRIVDNAYPTSDGGTMRISFEPGLQTMDGETALIYARTRHSDDDYQRAGRQQQVLQAVLEKLTTASGMFRLPLVVSAVLDYTETTMNLAVIGQYAPALALYGRNPGMVESLVLTRDYLNFDESGRASPNISQVDPWVAEHLR
jgi:LCP family protein required for cell wall assembly